MNEKKYRYPEKQKLYYKNLSEEKKLENFNRAKARLSDEYKYMESRYNIIKQRYKNNKHFIKDRIDMYTCDFTMEHFLNHWEEHKKKFGFHCRLTNIRMVCLKAKGGKGVKYYGYSNGVSVDRLDPNIGYTKENIIFISNEANKVKSAVTKNMCVKILEIYKERNL
jgi:hypothetical protein